MHEHLGERADLAVSRLYLGCISAVSPLYLAYIPATSPQARASESVGISFMIEARTCGEMGEMERR